MKASRLFLLRLATATTVLVVFGLMSLGIVDLTTGNSYAHARLAGLPAGRSVMLDAERIAAAARNRGAFAAATDPNVGITMARGVSREIFGALATLDDYGQRVRMGPVPTADAQRIVVLGDSVAFGFGVADDQTIAHHLEQYLAAAMAPGQARPVVQTVACPGWNHHNACRFLKNHLHRLRPDLVLFVPIENDLHDSYAVIETGNRQSSFDPRRGLDFPHTSSEQHILLMMANYPRASLATLARVRAAGGIDFSVPHVVVSGLSSESRTRWRRLVDDTQDLGETLAHRGRKLAVGFVSYRGYETQFRAEVGARLPDLPMIRSFRRSGTADSLPGDPHPNAKFTRALAWCFAAGLVQQGAIPGARIDRLPAIPADYAERRLAPTSTAEAQAAAVRLRETWFGFLENEVVQTTAQGFHQIYGMVHSDGMVDRSLWVALRNDGRARVSLQFERLPASSEVYPLELQAFVNGVPAGRRMVAEPGAGDRAASFGFAVPAACRAAKILEVRIRASNWVISKIEGISRLASFKFTSIGLRD